jgi:hypothetical protein
MKTRLLLLPALIVFSSILHADISVFDVIYSYEREISRVKKLIAIVQANSNLTNDVNKSVNTILNQEKSATADHKDEVIDDMFKNHSVGSSFYSESGRFQAAQLHAKQYIIEDNFLSNKLSKEEILRKFKLGK